MARQAAQSAMEGRLVTALDEATLLMHRLSDRMDSLGPGSRSKLRVWKAKAID